MADSSSSTKPYGTVLVKAKDILDFLLASPNAPTLAEITAGLHSSKPTILKILTTMDMLGLVRRDEQTKQYYIDTQLVAYAQKALDSIDIAKVARPFLQRLRDETGETINLGLPRHDKVVLIEKLESPNSIKLQSVIGGTMNMYSSAMGKALLSHYTSHQLKKYLETHPLVPMTSNTITSQTSLQKNLKVVQDMGVAVDNEENEPEIFCLGASIIKNGHVYGAFSISTPKYRLPKERQSEFVRLILNTQHDILAAL